MQDAKIAKNSPSGHHRTTLSGYIFGNWRTRGYANWRIANSRTGHLADWSIRGLDNSRTSQLADWTTRGLADAAKRMKSTQSRRWHPRDVQSSSWQSASWRIRELSSNHIFATKAHIDNQKKNLLNSNISCTRPHCIVNLQPTNG